jgi:hypothetical protein
MIKQIEIKTSIPNQTIDEKLEVLRLKINEVVEKINGGENDTY